MVGPSGCGKSSLMKLISGLHPPASGALPVEGKPVDGPLKSVGMAFQNSNLLPWRNALENVLLPLEIVEPYRADFSQADEYARQGRRRCCESVGPARASPRSIPGSSPAACSSAPRSAAR